MKISRALLPAALAGALLMTGCSAGGAPSKDAAGAECLPTGDASSTIKIKGAVGTDAEITSKTPIKADNVQRSVLTAGEGDIAKAGQNINVAMAMFNGADGASIQQAPASDVPLDKDQLAVWAYEGLRCAQPGEQVVVVSPFDDVFGEDTDPTATGIENLTADDSIVVVLEVGKITDASEDDAAASATDEPGTIELSDLPKKAEGKAKAAPEGFPTVKLAKDGSPTITMPKSDAPDKLEVATIIEGDGETVEPGDRVYVNYRGVIWATGEEFDSSWSRGEPAQFTTNGVIGGFQKALEGQKVGSQIISVVPAEDGGYGAAQLEQMGHKADDTMVFVLDILGTVHAGE